MFKKILAASAALSCVGFFATPSFALNGVEALDMCVKNATSGCKVSSSPAGDIIIEGGAGGTVFCLTLESECSVLEKVVGSSGKPRKEYQVPESIVSSGSSSGDTGVPGTGGGGHTLGNSGGVGGGRGPTTPGVIQ